MSYIHEVEGWPAQHWDEAALSAPLSALRQARDSLAAQAALLDAGLRAQAALEALVQDAVASAAIEGEHLTAAEVRAVLAGETARDAQLAGMAAMTLDVARAWAAPLTAERLCDWHQGLFPGGRSGLTAIRTGGWRDDSGGAMQIVSGPLERPEVLCEAPAAVRLPQEMQVFLAWFGSSQTPDPFLKAGLAHFWFVTLHPFDDGNGRTGRAILDLALARAEQGRPRLYSLSAAILRQRKGYYQALSDGQSGDLDITAWQVWFLGCLTDAVRAGEAELARTLRVLRFWQRWPEESFNLRQHKVLGRLLAGFDGKLTAAKWAALTKSGLEIAQADIADLLARAVLRQDEGGSRKPSYLLADISAPAP